jgi:SAM-dependent methyltransferase
VQLKKLVPNFLRPAVRTLYHGAFRARLRSEWRLRDRFERYRGSLPVPPARLRFRVGEDSRLSRFLDVGRRTAENIESALSQVGAGFGDGLKVLDFGCGCARTLRWLIYRYPHVHWSGVDVDAEAIEWCRTKLPGAEFACGQPMPPLPPLPGGADFDLIYAVSVFTHLNEDFQRAWVGELERVLKPGGILLVSVYGEHVWRAQPEARAVAEGKFVFRTSEKLMGILPDWYHTALQSRERVTALLEGRFVRVRYLERALGDHDAVIAWKE